MRQSLAWTVFGAATTTLILASATANAQDAAALATLADNSTQAPNARRFWERPRYSQSSFFYTYPARTYERSYYYVQPVQNANTVQLRIRLPESAQLWIEEQEMPQRGGERLFASPPLTPGRDYTYHFKAQWRDADGKSVVRARNVDVRANASVMVDLMQPTP
jgi:uncharacterized protein (TIGR03000 family)